MWSIHVISPHWWGDRRPAHQPISTRPAIRCAWPRLSQDPSSRFGRTFVVEILRCPSGSSGAPAFLGDARADTAYWLRWRNLCAADPQEARNRNPAYATAANTPAPRCRGAALAGGIQMLRPYATRYCVRHTIVNDTHDECSPDELHDMSVWRIPVHSIVRAKTT